MQAAVIKRYMRTIYINLAQQHAPPLSSFAFIFLSNPSRSPTRLPVHSPAPSPYAAPSFFSFLGGVISRTDVSEMYLTAHGGHVLWVGSRGAGTTVLPRSWGEAAVHTGFVSWFLTKPDETRRNTGRASPLSGGYKS